MEEKYDIVIVGAATTGVYFGWLMAKKGHSVLIIDKEKREVVGQRLEVIHFDKETFGELNVPAPLEPPELIGSWKGIWVSRLPLWLQRMYKFLEKDGIHFEFSCSFKELIFQDNKIIGIQVEKNIVKSEVYARLVVDASGVACAIRSKLPENYGVDTWQYDSSNRFFVILHYIKWLKPDEPYPRWGEAWPYHFIFLDPGYMGDWAIMGIIAPESFKTAEKIMEEFLNEANLPPFELKKKEYCSFPLTLPPRSLVGDAFLCLGDSAAIMNPIAARGIPETWQLSIHAAEVVDSLLKNDDFLSKEKLWKINVQYFRGAGADLAYQYMISAAIFNLKEKEINFLLKKLRHIVDPPGNDEEMNLKLGAGKIFKIVFKILGAILSGKISPKTIGRFIKQARRSGKAKKLYKKYPEDPKNLNEWIEKTKVLWALRKVAPRQFRTFTATYP